MSDDKDRPGRDFDDDAVRRFMTIVDIRSSPGGYKLSFEALMILVLVVSDGYILFPTKEERENL